MALKKLTALVQGNTVELTLNSSTGYYEATCTAGTDSSFNQSGGYFPVGMTAEDTAGNKSTIDSSHSTLGGNIRLFVYEQNKPTITITSPTAGAYVTDTTKPEITFKIVDNSTQASGYSGINKSSVVLKVNGTAVANSKITFTETTGGFIGKYTPETDLADGEVTITVDCKDNDGNAATTATITFRVDNLAPSLDVTAPADGLETNQSSVTVTGTTNDVNKPVTVTIKLNGVDCGAVTVNSDGSFSKVINLTQQGSNTIVVTATDASGKSTSQTKTVKYSTTAPVFTDVEIIYNGKKVDSTNKVPAGAVYTIRCKVTTS